VGTGEKLKVFISYSRRDSSDFVDELVAGLELAGFAPFLDRHDIAAGEEWEARLGGLIQQADTVVYVISPEAVKSKRCEWEVNSALTQSKRIMPVIFKTVIDAEIPEELRRRQFVRFDTGLGINRPLTQLAEALGQDLDWIREHTRLGELALRWEARGRPESLLLRGDELAAAQAWADKPKSEAPAITDLMGAFINTSKDAEAANFAKSRATQRRVDRARVVVVTLMCVLLMVVVGGLAAWRKQYWLKEHMYALTNVHALSTAQERALKPKDSFKECTDCPEMIAVPAGSFLMGSPVGQGDNDEHPQHNVSFAKPFAIAKYELTFDQWDGCVGHGDCAPHVSDSGWGRGWQPAINVSWDDAQSYVAWLSRITGKEYRLLSEAEYEYAARAGAQTVYPWGDHHAVTALANCEGCGSQWDGKQTAPVGSFAANEFGLYDMVGNVLEWVEDCYHGSYVGAPTDGLHWIVACQDDHLRIERGGSWEINLSEVRSARTVRQGGSHGSTSLKSIGAWPKIPMTAGAASPLFTPS
jgi:formylglycine-generating enzyme required for sulfatase activity